MPSNAIDKIKDFDKFGSVLGLERMEKLMQFMLRGRMGKVPYVDIFTMRFLLTDMMLDFSHHRFLRFSMSELSLTEN